MFTYFSHVAILISVSKVLFWGVWRGGGLQCARIFWMLKKQKFCHVRFFFHFDFSFNGLLCHFKKFSGHFGPHLFFTDILKTLVRNFVNVQNKNQIFSKKKPHRTIKVKKTYYPKITWLTEPSHLGHFKGVMVIFKIYTFGDKYCWKNLENIDCACLESKILWKFDISIFSFDWNIRVGHAWYPYPWNK